MIPQDVIDNIINTANIVDVIGDYVKPKIRNYHPIHD